MPFRRMISVAGVALLLGGSGAAQAPQTPPSVTFQVEVNYVDVDAVVTDEAGNFVPGLTREDFEVFEDGKPQKIEMFSYVELPVEPPDRFVVLDRPVTTDVRSNQHAFDGRVYVLVMDDLDISPLRGGLVKRAAREFVNQHFGANDIAAVVYTSGRTDATQDFTNNRELLLAAIDKFVGRRLRSAAVEALERHYQRQLTKGLGDNDAELAPDPGAAIVDAAAPIDVRDMERDHRAHAVLDTLRNLGDFLSGVRGRRKAVLLFSEGLEMPIREIYGVRTATDVVGAIKDAITAAARSNVNFFALDPRGLVGMTTEFIELAGSGAPDVATGAFGSLNAQQGLITDIRVSQDTLRTLAEETGGFAAVNTNDLSSAFGRIVDANSRYYVLGYYPPTPARDGRFHRIEVRVKRPGLRVSARRGYAAPRGRTPAERKRDDEARRAREARKGAVNNTSADLRDALNAPLQQSGLPFSLQAAPFRLNQKEASVALAIEFDPGKLPFRQDGELGANSLELSFFGIDQDGRAQRSTRTELNLTLRPETLKRVAQGGLRANPRLSLAPGRYQVRVGVRESVGGQVGTVFYDLHVPDFRREPLMLSGLLLTAASAQATFTAQPDPGMPKVLPGPATSGRTFSRNDTVTVFAEIYDNISRQQPRQIDTAVALISETGQEVFSAKESIPNPSTPLGAAAPPSNGTGGGGYWTGYGFARDVPLKNVEAGRYLLRVEARLRGGANAIARETLITVQP
ncbi:MAG: VWA domain-containing protein [Acidobacteria bacterium]|nr:MAG: VWA domain-containing protein [Acidobacteriota bacterium]